MRRSAARTLGLLAVAGVMAVPPGCSSGPARSFVGYDNDTFALSLGRVTNVGVTIAKGLLNQLVGVGASTVKATVAERFGVPGVVANDPGRTAPGRQNPKAFVATDWDGRSLSWQLGVLFATASTTKLCTDTAPATTQTTVEQRSYDGDGSLTTVTTIDAAGVSKTSTLSWDVARGVSQIAASSTGGVTSNYVYGQHRETVTSGAVSSAFTYNALGDTVATPATASSAVAGGFDPWGTAQTNLQPGAGVRFGYRGELAVNGAIHLRARTYRPDLRQFTTTDPLPGINGTTTLADPYHYTNNNPTNLVDPSGLSPSNDDTFETRLETARLTVQSADAAAAAGAAYTINTVPGGPPAPPSWGLLAKPPPVLRPPVIPVTPIEWPVPPVPPVPPPPVGVAVGVGVVGFGAGLAIGNWINHQLGLTISSDSDWGALDDALAACSKITGVFVDRYGDRAQLWLGLTYEDLLLACLRSFYRLPGEGGTRAKQWVKCLTGQPTNLGEASPDFNQAMKKALEWLLPRGFKAEVPTIGKFGSTAGRPIGMQTADGKVDFRVEFDARSGAHINVWAAKEKGPHFMFTASEATVERIQRLFEMC